MALIAGWAGWPRMVVATVWAFSAAAGAGEGADERVRMTAEAMTALREGGYVVVMSHGPAVIDEFDVGAGVPGTCVHQHPLTDTGRLMASGVGKLLAREGVPVGVVVSSRYCRGLETAERIAQYTHTSKLRSLDELNELSEAATRADMSQRAEALRRLASAAPATGTNTIVITHRSNMAAAFGDAFSTVGDGEFAVFRPHASGPVQPYRLAYRFRVEDLSNYAKASQRNPRPVGP